MDESVKAGSLEKKPLNPIEIMLSRGSIFMIIGRSNYSQSEAISLRRI